MKRIVALFLFASLFVVGRLEAQVSWHLYIVPIVGTGTAGDNRRAKYAFTPDANGNLVLNFQHSAMDYGTQPIMLMAANVTNAVDATLSAEADVQKIPDNLDAQIGGAALSIVQNALENRNLPSGWVTQSMTYRELLRTVGGFFAFMQRYNVVSGTNDLLMGGSVNLNTQFNQLPQPVRQALQATALDLNLNTTGMSGTTTLRVILKNIADQWGQRVIVLGGITI